MKITFIPRYEYQFNFNQKEMGLLIAIISDCKNRPYYTEDELILCEKFMKYFKELASKEVNIPIFEAGDS